VLKAGTPTKLTFAPTPEAKQRLAHLTAPLSLFGRRQGDSEEHADDELLGRLGVDVELTPRAPAGVPGPEPFSL
jgi:hypothetical protein